MALDFDGSNDYILSSRPFTSTDNWSLAAWINIEDLPTTGNFEMAVYNGGDGGAGPFNGYGFGVGGDNGGQGSKLIGLYGGVAWKNTSYTFSSADTWYHVTMVRTSGTLTFTVNGADIGYTNTGDPQLSGNITGGDFTIAAQQRNSEGVIWNFDGRVAEVGAWNRALDSGERNALGKGYSPLFFLNSLESYFPIVNTSDTNDRVRTVTETVGDVPTSYPHPAIIYPSPAQIRKFTTSAAPAVVARYYRSLMGVGI